MFNIDEFKNFIITHYDTNKNGEIDLNDNLPSWMKCLFNSDNYFNYEGAYNVLIKNNIKSLNKSIFDNIFIETVNEKDDKPFDITSIKHKISLKFLKWTAYDGKIGHFKQGTSGDCYFLSSLQAISNTKGGQKIIADSIKKVNNTYKVQFAGAIKVKNNIERQIRNKQIRGKCYISGNYTITPNEIKIAQENNKKTGKYSTGDLDVLIFELALEKYRKELKLTRDSSPELKNLSPQSAEYGGMGNSYNEAMNGGHGFDAMFLLTGEKSLYWSTNQDKNKLKPYVKGKYQQITRKDFISGNYSIEHRKVYEATAETYGTQTGAKKRHELLTSLEGQGDKYGITVGVRYKTEFSEGWHEITVEKVTSEYVYISNPHDNNIIEIVPRNEFEQMIDEISACPVKKKDIHNDVYNVIQQLFQQHNLRQTDK